MLKIEDQYIYDKAQTILDKFFRDKGFTQVTVQDHLSILSACEDPSTIGEFSYTGSVWPLKQSGQMDLEEILLRNPDINGIFCNTTSYRQEANPIANRHSLIFPMKEFEARGKFEDLVNLEKELLDYLGFDKHRSYNHDYHQYDYAELCDIFKVKELTHVEEERMCNEISPVVFIKNFPESTSPFFNMKRNDDGTASKCDVILYGQETIGSAARENDKDVMLHRFNTISGGEYAKLLYAHFGRERVLSELGRYLDLTFTDRFGAGMGMTRLIRAIKLNECIK